MEVVATVAVLGAVIGAALTVAGQAVVGAIGFLILFFLICFVSRKRTDRTQNI